MHEKLTSINLKQKKFSNDKKIIKEIIVYKFTR